MNMSKSQYQAMITLGVDATKSLQELSTQLQTIGNNVEKSLSSRAKKSGNQLKTEVANGITQGAKKGAEQSESFFATITRQVRNRLTLTLAQGVIDAYKTALKSIISNVKELNDAQTEFKKVSDLTGNALDAYTEKAAKMGRVVGRTATEMISAATEFRKSGYSDSDSLILAKVATMYQNIADEELTAADASSFIIAQMKAFNMEAKDAEHIIGAVNEVSNRFAVSSSDLANNLGTVASVLGSSGTTYEQMIGLMTAGTEINRNASKTANSLAMTQSRYNQILDETSSVGKKLSSWYAEHGIEVRDEEGNLRSLWEMLSDVASQWNTLSEDEKAYFTQLAAGTNRYKQLRDIMNNFTTAQKAASTAENENASAAKENAKYQESLQFALANLQAAWVQLSNDLIKSGTLTKLVNFATEIVELLDKMTNTIGGLPTMFLSVVASVGTLNGVLRALTLPSQLISSLGGRVTGSGLPQLITGGATSANVACGAVTTGSLLTNLKNANANWKNLSTASDVTSILAKDFSKLTATEKEVISANNILTAQQEIYNKTAKQATLQAGKYTKAQQALAKAESAKVKDSAKIAKAQTKLQNASKNALKWEQRAAVEANTLAIAQDNLKNATNKAQQEVNLAAQGGNAYVTVLRNIGKVALPALLVVAGLWLGKLADESHSLEKNVDKIQSTQETIDELTDAYTKAKDELGELQDKRESDGLTAAEEARLRALEAQTEEYEKQLEAYRELYGYEVRAAGKVLVRESQQTNGSEYGYANQGVAEVVAYNKALQAQEVLRKKMQKMTVGTEEWSNANDQLIKLKANTEKAGDALGSYYNTMNENLGGNNWDYLEDDAKKAFLEVQTAYFKSLVSMKDATVSVTEYNKILSYLDNFGNSKGLSDILGSIDIANLRSAEEMVEIIIEKIKELPKDKVITIEVDTDEGVKELEFTAEQLQALTDEEQRVVLTAYASGDWQGVVDWINQHPDGNVAKMFQDIVFEVKGEDDVKKARNDASKPINTKWIIGTGLALQAIQTVMGKIPTVFSSNWNINTMFPNLGEKLKGFFGIKNATGKRKGEQGGMSWLGDEGSSQNPKPELVVGDEGAYLAGTSGWEMYPIKSSDTVYTYAQTKKLLGGSQKFKGAVGSLPMYASGTNNEAFDDELAELEYQRAVKHWTDDYYLKQYKSLYSRYAGSLSASQVHSYGKFAEEVATDKAKAEVDRLQGILEETGRGLDDLVKKINNDSHFSADEKKELLQDAYKASVEYNTKEYKNGKDTRAKILEDIKKYYETRGSYDEEYYSMLNDLREADQDLEVERLSKLSNAEDEKLTLAQKYLQQQLDAVKKQIEANEEEADSMKDLKELQQDLADARKDMVRIYREGVGWVYEQNAEAIKDAQKAIEDYNREHMSDELEAEAEALQKVLDLFDDMQELSDIKELELSLGVGSLAELIGGNFGTNIAQWTKWIKSAIATQVGLEDLSTQIKNATGTDIDTWLGDVLSGGSHQASASTIASYISKHSFAGGTLSAGGGLSLVGENGAELAWLRKGDSVYSNAISSNLMQWGRYSPAEVLSGVSGGNKQTFNFDKIVLPNVKNADDFYKELQKLPNKAIQQSAMRA